MSQTKTHPAVVTVAPGAPLEILEVPTATPAATEIKILVQWTASTPLDMHQAVGHLYVQPPQILGSGIAGTVIEVGSEVSKHKVGDQVFGFVWRYAREKGHQQYVVAEEILFGQIPNSTNNNVSLSKQEQDEQMQKAVTLPDNFVTAWHLITADFGLNLEWPKKADNRSSDRQDWILIWGGGSSVAQYTLQVFNWYGYHNIGVVASKKHEEKLKRLGAAVLFDYRDGDVASQINEFQTKQGHDFAYVLDAIGSLDGSVRPISHFARAGTKVAIVLPVITTHAAKDTTPEYSMDVQEHVTWGDGVEAVGIRTHLYLENKFLAEKLQSEIMPEVLRLGVIEPNERVVVEGTTMLNRAQKAMDMLRDQQVSGARLVWQVSEDDVIERVLADVRG